MKVEHICVTCQKPYNLYFIMPHDQIAMGLDPFGPNPIMRHRCYECVVRILKEKKEFKGSMK